MDMPVLEVLNSVCITKEDIAFLDKYMFQSKSAVFVLAFEDKIPYIDLVDNKILDIISTTKKEIKIAWANDVFLKQMQIESYDDILGYPFIECLRLNGIHIEELNAILFNLYKRNGTSQYATIRRRDTSKIIVEGQYNVVVDPNHDILGIIGFQQDITKQAELEEKLLQLQNKYNDLRYSVQNG